MRGAKRPEFREFKEENRLYRFCAEFSPVKTPLAQKTSTGTLHGESTVEVGAERMVMTFILYISYDVCLLLLHAHPHVDESLIIAKHISVTNSNIRRTNESGYQSCPNDPTQMKIDLYQIIKKWSRHRLLCRARSMTKRMKLCRELNRKYLRPMREKTSNSPDTAFRE